MTLVFGMFSFQRGFASASSLIEAWILVSDEWWGMVVSLEESICEWSRWRTSVIGGDDEVHHFRPTLYEFFRQQWWRFRVLSTWMLLMKTVHDRTVSASSRERGSNSFVDAPVVNLDSRDKLQPYVQIFGGMHAGVGCQSVHAHGIEIGCSNCE
jgi:hypothetical protein